MQKINKKKKFKMKWIEKVQNKSSVLQFILDLYNADLLKTYMEWIWYDEELQKRNRNILISVEIYEEDWSLSFKKNVDSCDWEMSVKLETTGFNGEFFNADAKIFVCEYLMSHHKMKEKMPYYLDLFQKSTTF